MPLSFSSLLSPTFFCFLLLCVPHLFPSQAWGHGDTRGLCLTRPMVRRVSVLPTGAHQACPHGFPERESDPFSHDLPPPWASLPYLISDGHEVSLVELPHVAHVKSLPVLLPPLARMQCRYSGCAKPDSGFASCPLPTHRVFPQPLPLAPPSAREGEGEPSRAGREVPSGTAGPGRLWQHQKCHQACPHVSDPCPQPQPSENRSGSRHLADSETGERGVTVVVPWLSRSLVCVCVPCAVTAEAITRWPCAVSGTRVGRRPPKLKLGAWLHSRVHSGGILFLGLPPALAVGLPGGPSFLPLAATYKPFLTYRGALHGAGSLGRPLRRQVCLSSPTLLCIS